MLIEKIGPHILYNTQCQRGLPRLKENSINTVICDPPYGTTLLQWDTVIDFEWLWPALNRVCKNRHVLFSSQPFTSKLLVSNERAFSHEVVWEKTITGNPYLAKKMPMKKHENILVFNPGTYNPQMEKGDPYTRAGCEIKQEKNTHKYGAKRSLDQDNVGTRYPSSVQLFKREWRRQDQIHPTQKPLALMCWLTATYSNPADAVLDFSFGSGQTGIACAYLGRKFVGVEKDPQYFDIACARIEEAHKLYLKSVKRGHTLELELHRHREQNL